MILLALVLVFLGTAFCLSAILTFTVSLLLSFDIVVPLKGPLAVMTSTEMMLLGWGQVAVGSGLLLASLRALSADRERQANDASR